MRDALGITGLYFPVVQLIEFIMCNPENNIGLQFEIVEAKEMPERYADTNTAHNLMRIREDCYERAVQGYHRDRFTLCHELGHYLMHRPDRIQMARGDVPAYQSPEWQANTFAGELLVPIDKIRGMSVEQICKECGVSKEVARIQQKQCYGI